jgi:hypothetical protein
MRALASLAVVAALSPRLAPADVLYVEPRGITPFVDIQPAIDAASDGDVILVFPGDYGPVDFQGKDLVVRSTDGPLITTIDATGTGGPAALFEGGEPPTAMLHGFTLTGGQGVPDDSIVITVGGGVYITRQSSPRISGNWIVGNSADSGAGIGVTDGAPRIYGNEIRGNTAAIGAGGVLVVHPVGSTRDATLACNQIVDNVGGTVGGVLVDGNATARNNIVHGNVGDRGGVLFALAAVGEFSNNTVTTNEASLGNAAGVEIAGPGVVAVGNLVAHNVVGVGVVHGEASPAWSYGNLWDNDGGAWTGGSTNPAGTDGNLEIEPTFVAFTQGDPYDDDLSLVATDVLRDVGSPDAGYLDLDGSVGAIGADGGQRAGCDGDGDGVRVDDVPGDCLPDDPDYHPFAYEVEGGTDNDCDGYGTLDLLTFLDDDEGLTPVGSVWEYDVPLAVPGAGWESLSAWCTGCASGPGPSQSDQLGLGVDLTAIPSGTEARLLVTHAYDGDSGDGGVVQVWDGVDWETVVPDDGYPLATLATFPGSAGALGAWGGSSAGYVIDGVPLTDSAGTSADLRFWFVSGPGSSGAGWTVARLAVQVVDADGDGRAAALTDCDDTEPTVYEGAPETPYDGVDQDCDGADLVDADGDGYDGVPAGGDDCDDEDPTTNPAGVEIPYDEIDQDCVGGDLVDVDGDGAASWEAGGPDCDDGDPAIGPAGVEIPYDGIDQDCSGDDLVDVDGDGFRGGLGPPFGDCDDNDASVYPGAPELCDDGVDNDCNGLLDELIDLDGDGWDVCAGDCDETSSAVHPGQPEECTGVDDNCDGVTLDGEVDVDGDGELRCAGDCLDSDPNVGLTHPEVCDGIDNDCDLGIDEGLDLDGDGYSGCTSDCDDQRNTVYPGAAIDCADNLDHDCDGVRDFEQPECTDPPGCALGAGAGSGGLSSVLLVVAVLGGRRRRRRGVSGP